MAMAISHGAPSATAQQDNQTPIVQNTRIAVLQPFIARAARRFAVPEHWIRSVIMAESGGRLTLDGVPITSPAGAMGPMQLMPETYADMSERYGLGRDPYDPEQNILAGTAYLAELHHRFGYPGLFAAYNAGPERYQEYLDAGRPLPAETKAYLDALNVAASGTRTAPDFESGFDIFFPLARSAPRSSIEPLEGTGAGLFIALEPPANVKQVE